MIRRGVTRTVILTKRHAIKVPSWRGHVEGGMRGRLAGFALGILANQNEGQWSRYEPWAGKIAPVLHSWIGGLVQVYPRCAPLPATGSVLLPHLDPDPGDSKPDNYGLLGGRVVRLDYAQ